MKKGTSQERVYRSLEEYQDAFFPKREAEPIQDPAEAAKAQIREAFRRHRRTLASGNPTRR